MKPGLRFICKTQTWELFTSARDEPAVGSGFLTEEAERNILPAKASSHIEAERKLSEGAALSGIPLVLNPWVILEEHH